MSGKNPNRPLLRISINLERLNRFDGSHTDAETVE